MDKELLKELYRQFYKEIYLYLYSLSSNAYLAEDLTQDTFVKALLSLSDSHTNMRAWLYMVARNLYFNYRKKNKVTVPTEDISDEVADVNIEKQLNRIFDDERNKVLYAALNKIDEKYREVLTMQYFGKLSQKDIAKVLNVSHENVRILSYRGKLKLKQKLEEEHYEI